MRSDSHQVIIENTGKDYDQIIFEDDFIPSAVYRNQISIRNKFLSDALTNKVFNRTLDLGCGTGFHYGELKKRSSLMISVDMSIQALKICKNKDPGEYVQCDINFLPFRSGSFNLIWIAGVLHHTPRTIKCCLKDISRILDIEGVFIVDEPNSANLINYFVLLLSKADPTGDEKPISARIVSGIMHECDLSITSISHYGFACPLALFFGFETQHIFEKIDHKLKNSILSRLLLRWVIIAKKERRQ